MWYYLRQLTRSETDNVIYTVTRVEETRPVARRSTPAFLSGRPSALLITNERSNVQFEKSIARDR